MPTPSATEMSHTRPRRVALVTGATKGLGEAMARRLAHDGMSVILTGTRLSNCEAVVASLHAIGLTATVAMALDVNSEASVLALFVKIEKDYGRLDVLVNNAGIAPRVNGKKVIVEDTP